jgi:hypothetical protein
MHRVESKNAVENANYRKLSGRDAVVACIAR